MSEESNIAKYIVISNKIKPHLDYELKTGKRDMDDYKQLLKRLKETKELSLDEYKYTKSNMRLILLTLGLFHLLPEIITPENLEYLFLQVSRLIISSGKYSDRNTAIKELNTLLQTNFIDREQLMYGVKPGDISSLFNNLNDKLKEMKKENEESKHQDILKNEVVKLLNEFKDSCMDLGVSGTAAYKIQSMVRDLKSGKFRYFDDFIEILTSWQSQYVS